MPASATSHPPKNCPVCWETVWVKWGTSNHDWPWYRKHLKSNHPEYEKWHSRIVVTYFVALIPFLSFFVLAAMMPTADVNYFAILPFPSAFLVITLVWIAQHSGTGRFRNAWKTTHNVPLKVQ